MALTITSIAEGDTVTLALAGRLGALETPEFNAAFAEKTTGMKLALLDFSNVEYISSAGLRSLFTANKIMARQGGEMRLLYPSEEVG